MGKIEQAAAVEAKPGETVDAYLQRIIAEEGTVHKAAIRIGVYPNTIKYWFRTHGLKLTSKHRVSVEKVAADA